MTLSIVRGAFLFTGVIAFIAGSMFTAKICGLIWACIILAQIFTVD